MTGRGERQDVFRYVPPDQTVARARTWIGDVLLEFTLTFTGSLLVSCAEDDTATEDRAVLRQVGEALDRIAEDVFVSAVHVDRPRIESAGGHRFTHASSSVSAGTRRFAGECAVAIPARAGIEEPAVTGSLTYVLDVTIGDSGEAWSDDDTHRWTERYDRTLATVGALVLEPVPVAVERAARLYVA